MNVALPTLTITVLPNGKMTVNRPRDKLLCMKMLAQAIVLVEEYTEPTIVQAETIHRLLRNQG